MIHYVLSGASLILASADEGRFDYASRLTLDTLLSAKETL